MNKLKNKITKSISIGALILVFVFNANAQDFEIGARFMPTFSSFGLKNSSGGTVSGNVVLGLGIGGFLGYNFSKHFGVQGEIIYSSLAQKYTEIDVERQINLGYINIPLLLSYNTGKNETINFNAVFGPQIGISTGSNLKVNNTGPTVKNAKMTVKAGDLGLAYGAGVDFGVNSAKTIRIGVGFRGV